MQGNECVKFAKEQKKNWLTINNLWHLHEGGQSDQQDSDETNFPTFLFPFSSSDVLCKNKRFCHAE